MLRGTDMGNIPPHNNSLERRMLGVSIDIEDWYHIPPVCGTPSSKYRDVEEFRRNWSKRYDYITEPTRRTLDMLNRYDIDATIFVVADVVNHYPDLIDDIRSRGRHEIGCHGLMHVSKIHPRTKRPMFDASTFVERTALVRKTLEDAFGTKVNGYRAPIAYIGGWMMDALEKMGFAYSSSVSANSFYNKTDSALAGVGTAPYYPEAGSLNAGKTPRNIVEVPFAHYNLAGIRVPINGGPLLRFLGLSLTIKGLRACLRTADSIFYFHPLDLCTDEFPTLSVTNKLFWWVRGERVQGYVERILSALKEETEFVPLYRIAEGIKGTEAIA